MRDDIDDFLSMTEEERMSYIEDILLDLLDQDLVEIVGFNQNNEPLFQSKEVK